MSLCGYACKAVLLKSIRICLWSDFSAVSLFLTPAPLLISLKTPIYKPAQACLFREEELKHSAHRLGDSAEMQAELLLTQRVITRWNKSAGRVPEMSQKLDQATARALCLQAEGGRITVSQEKVRKKEWAEAKYLSGSAHWTKGPNGLPRPSHFHYAFFDTLSQPLSQWWTRTIKLACCKKVCQATNCGVTCHLLLKDHLPSWISLRCCL